MIQFDEHIFQKGWFNHQLVLQAGKQIIARPALPSSMHQLSQERYSMDVFCVFQWSDATSLEDPFVVLISVGSLESQVLSL